MVKSNEFFFPNLRFLPIQSINHQTRYKNHIVSNHQKLKAKDVIDNLSASKLKQSPYRNKTASLSARRNIISKK